VHFEHMVQGDARVVIVGLPWRSLWWRGSPPTL
jgi:hypothetical protein